MDGKQKLIVGLLILAVIFSIIAISINISTPDYQPITKKTVVTYVQGKTNDDSNSNVGLTIEAPVGDQSG